MVERSTTVVDAPPTEDLPSTDIMSVVAGAPTATPGSLTATSPDDEPPPIIDVLEHPVSKSARAMDAAERVTVSLDVMALTLRPAASKKC
jgi:hypothetical protein